MRIQGHRSARVVESSASKKATKLCRTAELSHETACSLEKERKTLKPHVHNIGDAHVCRACVVQSSPRSHAGVRPEGIYNGDAKSFLARKYGTGVDQQKTSFLSVTQSHVILYASWFLLFVHSFLPRFLRSRNQPPKSKPYSSVCLPLGEIVDEFGSRARLRNANLKIWSACHGSVS